MPVEIIGMVGTRDASEIKGPLVDGPVVDWMDGPGYRTRLPHCHLPGPRRWRIRPGSVGYGAVGPEGWAVASSVLNCTKLPQSPGAHRPEFVQPVVTCAHGGHAGSPHRGRSDRHPLHHRRR